MGKVLVTGATGFLGQHLVRALVRQGESVRVAVHAAPLPDDPTFGACERVDGVDVRDPRAVARAVEGSSKVIHLVSNFRRPGSDGEAEAINVGGTENVLAAAARFGVDQVIHCSTIGVHGSVTEVPSDESSPYAPGDRYQQSKLEAEQRVRAAQAAGLNVTVLRPVSMYGPGDTRMLKLFRMVKRGWFVRAGSGRTRFQPSHVDDVVAGFMLVLGNQAAAGGTFIVGGEESVTLDTFAAMLGEALGVRVRTVRVPLAPLTAAAWLCEMACRPFGIDPPLYRRRLSFFQNERVFTVRHARETLGYRPRVSLQEGLRETAAWYRRQGWL